METIVNFLKWMFTTPYTEMTLLHGVVFAALVMIVIFILAVAGVIKER